MNLTPLKYLLYLENVTSVFRNYLCLKRPTRIIVLFWVFIEALNISLTAAANFVPALRYRDENVEAYFFLSAGFSVYLLIASLYNCKRFYMLLLNFDAFYKSFDDGIYYQKMLRAQKVSAFRVVLVFGFIIVLFTYFRFPIKCGSLGWVVTIISMYCCSMSDVRYILQYFVMHCILFVISEQIKVITRSVDSELSAIIERRRDVEHADLSSAYVNHDKVNKWVKVYKNINESANLFNSMFSNQVILIFLFYLLPLMILPRLKRKGPCDAGAILMGKVHHPVGVAPA